MVILHEGSPVKVMEFHHHTPGNLRAMVQARLRNLLTGNSFEFRFRSNDTLERVIQDDGPEHYREHTLDLRAWFTGGDEPADAEDKTDTTDDDGADGAD